MKSEIAYAVTVFLLGFMVGGFGGIHFGEWAGLQKGRSQGTEAERLRFSNMLVDDLEGVAAVKSYVLARRALVELEKRASAN